MGHHFRHWLSIGAIAVMVAACNTSKEEVAFEDEPTSSSAKPDKTADVMYTEARALFDKRQYSKAVEAFEEIEREYPYSEWSVKAKIMAAYASYKQREFEQSVAILDQFIKLHPGSESIAYAYYLRALNFYDQIADIKRDQQITTLAQQSLEDVIRRFPDSEYAQDAALKLDLVRDHLAGKEMEIGRYYLKRGDYLAAINRFRYVVDTYDTTTHAPEALYRLVEAYLALGVQEEAIRAAAVLGHNYPADKWYKRAYALINPDAETLPQAESKDSLWQKIKDAM